MRIRVLCITLTVLFIAGCSSRKELSHVRIDHIGSSGAGMKDLLFMAEPVADTNFSGMVVSPAVLDQIGDVQESLSADAADETVPGYEGYRIYVYEKNTTCTQKRLSLKETIAYMDELLKVLEQNKVSPESVARVEDARSRLLPE